MFFCLISHYFFFFWFVFFFFLMIRRPPRSTLFSLHDALPISPAGSVRSLPLPVEQVDSFAPHHCWCASVGLRPPPIYCLKFLSLAAISRHEVREPGVQMQRGFRFVGYSALSISVDR